MKTSRINGSSESIYQKGKKLAVTDQALFHSNMQQGLHQHLKKQPKKSKDKNKQHHKLVNQQGRLIIKGIIFANEKSPQIHNQLLQNAHIVYASTKMKVRNNIYKNSI